MGMFIGMVVRYGLYYLLVFAGTAAIVWAALALQEHMVEQSVSTLVKPECLKESKR